MGTTLCIEVIAALLRKLWSIAALSKSAAGYTPMPFLRALYLLLISPLSRFYYSRDVLQTAYHQCFKNMHPLDSQKKDNTSFYNKQSVIRRYIYAIRDESLRNEIIGIVEMVQGLSKMLHTETDDNYANALKIFTHNFLCVRKLLNFDLLVDLGKKEGLNIRAFVSLIEDLRMNLRDQILNNKQEYYNIILTILKKHSIAVSKSNFQDLKPIQEIVLEYQEQLDSNPSNELAKHKLPEHNQSPDFSWKEQLMQHLLNRLTSDRNLILSLEEFIILTTRPYTFYQYDVLKIAESPAQFSGERDNYQKTLWEIISNIEKGIISEFSNFHISICHGGLGNAAMQELIKSLRLRIISSVCTKINAVDNRLLNNQQKKMLIKKLMYTYLYQITLLERPAFGQPYLTEGALFCGENIIFKCTLPNVVLPFIEADNINIQILANIGVSHIPITLRTSLDKQKMEYISVCARNNIICSVLAEKILQTRPRYKIFNNNRTTREDNDLISLKAIIDKTCNEICSLALIQGIKYNGILTNNTKLIVLYTTKLVTPYTSSMVFSTLCRNHNDALNIERFDCDSAKSMPKENIDKQEERLRFDLSSRFQQILTTFEH